jgi:uncharacterized membrane protein YdjX (TVP38/TMEM64 family)
MKNKVRFFKNPWFKLVATLLFFVLVYLVLRISNIDYTKMTPEALRNKILSFGIWAPIIYITFYTLRPLVLFPAGVFSMVGGLAFGPFFGTIYVIIGATISAVVEFLIARISGRGAVAKFMKGKIVSVDEAIEKHGFKTVLLVRLIPNVSYDIQNYSLGLTKVRFRDYFIATFLGIIPGSFAFVYLGHSLTDFRHAWKIMLAVSLIVAICFTQNYFKKRR